MDIWTILLILSIFILVVYWAKGRNAVWGGFTLGIIIGFIIAFVSVFGGSGFAWLTIERCAIIGTLFGFLSEILGIISDYIKRVK